MRRPDAGQHRRAARAGYDGAKRKRGSKLHLAVDTLGHLLAPHVTPADADGQAEAGRLAEAVQHATGDSVTLAYVDQGCMGGRAAEAAQAHGTASSAYADIHGQLSPDDAARFDQDVRSAASGLAARVRADAATAASTGLMAGGKRILVDNPILTKQWEGTASKWTGKGGSRLACAPCWKAMASACPLR